MSHESYTRTTIFVIDNFSLPHKNRQASSVVIICAISKSSKSLMYTKWKLSEKNSHSIFVGIGRRGFTNGLSHNWLIAMATLNKQRSRHSHCMKSKTNIFLNYKLLYQSHRVRNMRSETKQNLHNNPIIIVKGLLN
jgi:hypothetical protein